VTRLVSADAVVTGIGVIGNAVLIDHGRVVATGQREDLATSGILEERFPGATIIPGLKDAHIHAVALAALLRGCSLKSAVNIADLQSRIARYGKTLAPGMPVVAMRFDDEALAERRIPTRSDLDRAVPNRPTVIYRYCGHIAVANSAALVASGITDATRNPTGGAIDRDGNGVATGVLREAAVGLVAGALSRAATVTPDDLADTLGRLAGLGVTSIGAMIGYGEAPSERLEAEVELWRDVAKRLPVKVHGFVIADTPDRLESSAKTLTGAGQRLRWLGVKRFSDGSLGGHTAAMREPYADAETTGVLRLTPSDTEVARHSLRLGGMVAVHAIGDRAIDQVLNLFETLLLERADADDLRMEHASVMSPSQIGRLAGMGCTAVLQPAFLASESAWVGSRVGRDRLSWLYPFRSLMTAGIPTAGSSDCPVEPPHPLWGMAAAMDRYGISETERLTGLEALALFTSGSARALREPPPLSPGSAADLVVLDVDPATASPTDIHSAEVLDTYVDGSPVEVDRARAAWAP